MPGHGASRQAKLSGYIVAVWYRPRKTLPEHVHNAVGQTADGTGLSLQLFFPVPTQMPQQRGVRSRDPKTHAVWGQGQGISGFEPFDGTASKFGQLLAMLGIVRFQFNRDRGKPTRGDLLDAFIKAEDQHFAVARVLMCWDHIAFQRNPWLTRCSYDV